MSPFPKKDFEKYAMSNLTTVAMLATAALISSPVFPHDWESSRPDAHAPISVMGDHTHKKGEIMFSYRHMRMEMNKLVDGDDSIPPEQLLESSPYMMVPTKMTMDMDMFGVMYAPSDTTTALAMLSYLKNDMDMLMSMPGNMANTLPGAMGQQIRAAMPVTSSMKSSGIGDLKFGVLHNLDDAAGQRVHLNVLVSIPTGSIDEDGSGAQRLPYRMQLGSGTYDLMPGITYAAQYEHFSWGAQAQAVIRLGKNDHDYRLGNRYLTQLWVQKPVQQRVAVSARIAYEKWRNINGADDELNPMLSPLADPALQAGELVTVGFGISATLPAGNRLAIEYNKELRQNLDGPQLAFNDSIVIAWQLSFN